MCQDRHSPQADNRERMSWARLRRDVYARDKGRCRVCLARVGRVWDAGHLVDRIVGGTDDLDNLVLMCARCNRTLKPITRSRAEALAWLEDAHGEAMGKTDWRPAWELMKGA